MKNFFISLLFFSIFSISNIQYVEKNNNEKINILLNEKTHLLETYYNIYLNNQIEISDNVFIKNFSNIEIINLLENYYNINNKESIKQKLYEKLKY